MRKFVTVVLLAEAFAVTTYAVGWWSVPVVAVVSGFVSSDSNRARIAALCAGGGWATLLLLDAAKGPVGAMATRLGGVMGIPPALLLLLTLVFPMLLAWTASTIIPQRGKYAATAERPA